MQGEQPLQAAGHYKHGTTTGCLLSGQEWLIAQADQEQFL